MSGNVVAWVFANYPADSEVSRNRKIVFSEVAEAATRDFDNAHPGVQSIVEHWGFGASTVRRHLAHLVEDEWLEVTKVGGGRGMATVYRIRRERGSQWAGLDSERGSQWAGLDEKPAHSANETRSPETLNPPNDESHTSLTHPVNKSPLENTPSLMLVPSSPTTTLLPNDERVFEQWIESANRTDRTVFSPKRRRLVRQALHDYPLEDVLDAVRGWTRSPFHSGDNPEHRVYNDLELLLRDAEHIERFRDLWRGHALAVSRADPATREFLDQQTRVSNFVNRGEYP